MTAYTSANIKIRMFKLLHLLLCVALFACTWFLFCRQFGINIAGRYHFFVCAVFTACMLFFSRIYNAYLIEYTGKQDINFSLSLSELLSIVLTIGAILIAWNKSYYHPWIFIILFVVLVVFNRIWTALAISMYYKLNEPLRTVIVYRNKTDLKRISEVEHYERKYRIEKYAEDPQTIEEAAAAIEGYDAVFIAGVNATLRNGIAKYCAEHNVQAFFLPHIGDILMAGAEHVQAFSVPIMSMQKVNDHPEYLIFKRLTDIVLSGLAIIVLSPFMLLTAIVIRLYDHGPALYKQVRLTKDGREFEILKFRSMRVDAEKDGVARLSSGENDPRITPVGRFIRSIRFDELPQLFNILKGDMTIVGPRPERPEIAAQYEDVLPAFQLRLKVKAGLTGYAQVYGRYNTDPYDKLEMDLLYISRMSFLEDIKLMFATIRILFKGDSTQGIDEGSVTALDDDA